MGCASRKLKQQSILPEPRESRESDPAALRPTEFDLLLDNFDYKAEPEAEPEAAQPAQIRKKERCEVHPSALPDLEDEEEEELEIEVEASEIGAKPREAIQKRKRTPLVPVEDLKLVDFDSEDGIDGVGKLAELEKHLPRTEITLHEL